MSDVQDVVFTEGPQRQVEVPLDVEVAFRLESLKHAVAVFDAYEDKAETVTEIAAIFLKFLKSGEAVPIKE